MSPRGPHRPHHPRLLGPRGSLLGAPPHLLLHQGPLDPVLGPHHRAPVARAPLLGHACVLDHPGAPVLWRLGPLLGHQGAGPSHGAGGPYWGTSRPD